MKFYLVAGAALFALSSVQAHAQSFPGARIEVIGGWDHTRAELEYDDTAFPEDNFLVSESNDGIVFGAVVGYDHEIAEGTYAGIEAGVDFADNKRCEEVFGNDAACFKVKRNLAIGGRLGMRMSARSMFYLGAAYVNGRATVTYTDETDPSFNFSESDNRDGIRLSGGVEYRLTGNMYVKGEYRFLDYKDYRLAGDTEELRLGFERHQVVGGVGVRF